MSTASHLVGFRVSLFSKLCKVAYSVDLLLQGSFRATDGPYIIDMDECSSIGVANTWT